MKKLVPGLDMTYEELLSEATWRESVEIFKEHSGSPEAAAEEIARVTKAMSAIIVQEKTSMAAMGMALGGLARMLGETAGKAEEPGYVESFLPFILAGYTLYGNFVKTLLAEKKQEAKKEQSPLN